MATVNPTTNTQSELPGSQDGSVMRVTWALTSSNPDGAPIPFAEYSDRTVVVSGTWGGATLELQGSNELTPTTFVQLNSAAGSAATATTNKAIQVLEVPLYFRPNLTVVGAGASITVTLIARRATPMRT